MDALTNARNEAQRIRSRVALAAKAAASSTSLTIPLGSPMIDHRQSLDSINAADLYSHFNGWVYAAVRPIAQRIAGQTIHVGRVASNRVPGMKSFEIKQSLPTWCKAMGDRIEPLDTHPILELLADPNQFMVAWSLVYSLIVNLELTGRGFWWVTYDGDRRVILPIPTHWVRGADRSTRYETWYIQPPGLAEPRPVSADEMIYFNYPHPADPHESWSPLRAAANAVLTDEAIQGSQRQAFDRGIMPKVIITAGRIEDPAGGPGVRPVLTPAQRRQLVSAIRSAHAGWGRWEEPAIIDGLIEKIDVLGRTIAEMDFQASGDITKSRIFKAFGVNPIIAGEVEGANRASATVADEHFCFSTVNPKIEMLSQVLTGWLGPMFATRNERLVVWIEKCRPNDPEQRYKEWSMGLARGAVSPNEFRREILNLPDMPGGDDPLAGPPAPAAAADVGMKGINPYDLTKMNGGQAWPVRG